MVPYQQAMSPLIILLPESMYDLNFDKIFDIIIELLPIQRLNLIFITCDLLQINPHDKIQVEQVIEVPTFFDHGIPQNILQSHSINILLQFQALDFSELNR
jgi:hypothetical protein